MAEITTADGERRLVGTWWDEDAAVTWAERLQRTRPGWRARVFELEFKDYWLPRDTNTNTITTHGMIDTPDIAEFSEASEPDDEREAEAS
jgi:hypothetical protein